MSIVKYRLHGLECLKEMDRGGYLVTVARVEVDRGVVAAAAGAQAARALTRVTRPPAGRAHGAVDRTAVGPARRRRRRYQRRRSVGPGRTV